MEFIKEHQFVAINEKESILINLLNGCADLIENDYVELIKSGKINRLPHDVIKLLENREYLFSSVSARVAYEKNLLKKLNSNGDSVVPIFGLIPTYTCNLACGYCYQKSYQMTPSQSNWISNEGLTKALHSMNQLLDQLGYSDSPKNVQLNLMGGEVFEKRAETRVNHILKKLKESQFSLTIISNGLEMNHFFDSLKKNPNLQHIQVTIDGCKSLHDKRRCGQQGEATYDRIMENVKLALEQGLPITLRLNLDNENIRELGQLANEIVERGFTKYDNFKAYMYLMQDAGCLGNHNVINEAKAIEILNEEENKNPLIAEVFQKSFHGINLINSIFSGESFLIRKSHCSASHNQYMFDYKGNIYKCWFGVGNESFRVGQYLPKFNIHKKQDQKWKCRDIETLEKCSGCKYRYLCGGGCVVSNFRKGRDIFSESCVPFRAVINKMVRCRYGNAEQK